MIYEAGNIAAANVEFKNAGEITSTVNESTDNMQEVAKNKVSYDTINERTISLGDSLSLKA